MVEIIERKDGRKSKKIAYHPDFGVQISYNSWGHLVIRGIIKDTHDILVVFDKPTSEQIINFIGCNIKEPVGLKPKPDDLLF